MRNPTQQVVLDALIAAAARGDACPKNDELAALIGAAGGCHASYTIKQLEVQGAIRVERFHQARRVTIVATGAATA